MFGKKKEELTVTPSTNEVKIKKGRKKKTLLRNLRETAWNIVYDEVFGSSYAVKTATHGYGLKVPLNVLESASEEDGSGAFIHLINKGSVKAMITDQMINEDYFTLLLDKETLLIVSEYSFVWDTPLEAIQIDSDGEVFATGYKYNLLDILAFVNGKANLCIGDITLGSEDNVMAEDWEDSEDEENEELSGSGITEDDLYSDLSDEGFTEESEPRDKEEEEEYQEGEPIEENEMESEGWSDNDWDEDEVILDVGGGLLEAEEPEVDSMVMKESEEFDTEQVVPTKELVSNVVQRIFSKEDLDIAVDTALFDAQFSDDLVTPFVEQRGDDELERHVSQMAKEANQKLIHKQKMNRAALRDKYITLMGGVCTSVLDHTDTKNPNTVPGQELTALEEARRGQYQRLEQQVAEKIAELDREWNTELEVYGNQARDAAIASYKQRHGYRNESKRAAVKDDLERSLHQQYEYGVSCLNTKRKAIANRLMDAGTNHTFSVISKMYAEQLHEEMNLRNQLEDEITSYVKHNYENELSRVRVLEQEMLDKTKAQQVQEEYEARLASLMGDLDRQAKTFDIDKQRFVEELKELEKKKDSDFDAYAEQVRGRYDTYEVEIKALRQELTALDSRKTQEFKHRMNALEDQLKASNVQIETSANMLNMEVERSKRSGRVSVVIMAGVAIVMLAVGVLGGTFLRLENAARIQDQTVPYEQTSEATNGGENAQEE